MAGFLKEIFQDPSIAERFLCCICLMVFRDAVQNPCSHRYCESCIKEKIKNESEKRCPACPDDSSDGVIDELYPDFVARKEIKKSHVTCINEGCNWTGKFQEYSQEHEASCPFERIKCLKRGCGKPLKRGDLSHHLEKACPMRVIECRFCKKQLPYKEAKKHTTECPNGPVTCNCGKRVARSQMKKHLNPDTGDCIKRKAKCVLQPLGCNAKLKKNGAHASVDVAALHLQRGKKRKVDSLEREMAENKVAIASNQQGLAILGNELEALPAKFITYLKEVTERQEDVSYDGILLWRISEYNRRRQDAVSGKTPSFYSPVFYTSRHGYKMSALVYLNGDGMGENTNMLLFFVVMRGRHDALLPWPFKQTVTFMLLDQNKGDHIVDTFRPDPTSSSFKKPSSDMNIASGWSLSVPQELLMASNSYVKDDTMFIKVVVDTTDLGKL